MSAGRHDEDCRDRHRRIAASPASQIIALAPSFESKLGNGGGIVYQLDPYQIQFSFQRFFRLPVSRLSVHYFDWYGLPNARADRSPLVCHSKLRDPHFRRFEN